MADGFEFQRLTLGCGLESPRQGANNAFWAWSGCAGGSLDCNGSGTDNAPVSSFAYLLARPAPPVAQHRLSHRVAVLAIATK